MPLSFRRVCTGLLAAGLCWAAEGDGDPPRPGHEAPAAAAEACFARITWDKYTTLVVVGVGIGMVKPAWVATYEKDGGKYVVGYRATAFRDARGRLHIDARHASDVGPEAGNWSPDSFAFAGPRLWTLDDNDSGHTAETAPPTPAAQDAAGWRAAQLEVQALIEGGL